MAPEYPPVLVIFNSRFENDKLMGTVEYVECGSPKPNKRLRVRWGVESKPEDYISVGEGIAFVYNKNNEVEILPKSIDDAPKPLGNDQYLWSEGLDFDIPWLMFILILPPGYTLDDPDPKPAGTKIFQERMALYWTLPGDKLNRTSVKLRIKELQQDLDSEIMRVNKGFLAKNAPRPSTIDIEDTRKKWTKKALIPIVVAVVSGLILWGIQKLAEPKYGELVLECNLDSAAVYLNTDFVGITKKSEIVKFESLKPGTYILYASKPGYQSYSDEKLKISVGEITTKKIQLELAQARDLIEYVQITIQTPIRDANWRAIDVARRGEQFKFTGNIVDSPKGNQYYEIELGKNSTSLAYIWSGESELIKGK